MSEIKYITSKNILDINKNIYAKSLEDQKVIFGANSDDEIFKIEKLIECTPINKSIIEVAAYYLKNITILQAFSDGNHRTAIESILFFFRKNNYIFTNKMTLENTIQLQNDIDKACYEVYGYSYEIVGKAYFSNISALLSKLDRALHSDLVLTIFLEVSI